MFFWFKPKAAILSQNVKQNIVFHYKEKIFSLYTQQIEVKLVAIESAYFSHYAYTPFHFSRTLPLSTQ